MKIDFRYGIGMAITNKHNDHGTIDFLASDGKGKKLYHLSFADKKLNGWVDEDDMYTTYFGQLKSLTEAGCEY